MYTKGEWRAVRTSFMPWRIIGERAVAEILYDEENEPTLEELEANARLIAAAPMLYEALKALSFQFAVAVEHPYSRDKEIYEQVQQALAKVEGKETQ